MYTIAYMSLGRNVHSIAFLVLAAFIIVNLFGAAHSLGMERDAQGNMSGCFFTGTAICTMTPLEHFAAWQSMFTAATAKASNAILLLLLASALFAAFQTMRALFDATIDFLAARQKLYLKYSFAYSHLNPIQEAFSQGILHPKIY